MAGDIYHIPNFLSAKTKTGLRREFLLNNAKKHTMFQYFDISQEKDGSWTAWYFEKISLREELNGNKPKPSRQG